VTRPGIGVQIAEEQIAERLGVKGSFGGRGGIRQCRGQSRHPADPAGRFGRMHLGDVITAIDGKKVESPNELFIVLENYKVGETVAISLVREGKPAQAKVVLEAVQ
jgi:serine protease Do